MPVSRPASLPFSTRNLRPGLRLAVAVSGGADSTALLLALAERAPQLGLVLSVAHVHHGIRQEAADEDERFVAGLACQLRLPLHLHRADTPALARQQRQSLEEAARNVRYGWFRELMAGGLADAVATAHTRSDQAETVLHRLLRGAGTEGLTAIHPELDLGPGPVLRPLLHVSRGQVLQFLNDGGQAWCEDETNLDVAFTRNRIRHELLPLLAAVNPQAEQHLAQTAELAREEQAYFDGELARLLPSLLLPGRAVRGGGRASSTHPHEDSLAIEVERLRQLAPALRRRVMRAAAARLGATLDFDQTTRLLAMCGFREEPGPRRVELSASVAAERTPRELRLLRCAPGAAITGPPEPCPLPIAEVVETRGYGLRLRVEIAPPGSYPAALLRTPRPGDRVRLRYSSGPKRIKEVLDRMQVPSGERANWPLIEWQGQIVWLRGAELEPPPGVIFNLHIEDLLTEPG